MVPGADGHVVLVEDAGHVVRVDAVHLEADGAVVLRLRGDRIEEAAFTGHGCAVSQAAADMMADLVTGETVGEARRLSGLYLDMIKGRPLTDEERADLDEAAELESIARMPARVKCAELAWRTLEKLLDQQLEKA